MWRETLRENSNENNKIAERLSDIALAALRAACVAHAAVLENTQMMRFRVACKVTRGTPKV